MSSERNKEAKELINLEREILDLFKQQKYSSAETSIALDNLEKKILTNVKKRSKEEAEILSLQKEIEKSKIKIEKLTVSGASHQSIANEIEYSIKKAEELGKLQSDMGNAEMRRQQMINKLGLGKAVELMTEINDIARNNPSLLLGMTALYVWKKVLGAFLEMDTAAANFRISMGINRKDSKTMEESVRASAFEYARLGVTAEGLYKSISAIESSIGTSHAASAEMRDDIVIMTTQFGVAEKTSAEFLKSMAAVSATTMDSQKNMMFFVQGLSAAAGTNLSEVMSDIASSAKSGYQYLSREPLVLAKAAVEARKMGTSLSESVNSSKSILSFTQNVKEEMEASVLLGQSINLQHARELAYRRDLSGLNKEILKIAKETNFEQLDPFQQEAVAKALGKSADEVGKMLVAEKMRLQILRDPSLKEQRENYEKMMDANESIANSMAKNAKYQATIMSNQAAITAISLAWKGIVQKIGESFLPLIKTTLEGIAYILNLTNGGWGKWVIGIGSVIGAIGLLIVSTKLLGKVLGSVGNGVGKGVGGFFSGMSAGVSKMGNPRVLLGAVAIALIGTSVLLAAKGFKEFAAVDWGSVLKGVGVLSLLALAAGIMGKFFAPIGIGILVILGLSAALAVFSAAAKLTASAIKIFGDVNWDNITNGIIGLGKASNWVTLMGGAMLLAVPGLLAFSVALVPFSLTVNKVADSMIRMGSGFKIVVDSFERLSSLSLVGTILQVRNLASAISELNDGLHKMPDIKVEKLEKLSMSSSVNTQSKKEKDSDGMTLSDVVSELKALRKDLLSGAIQSGPVIMDGQQLNTSMGRNLRFRGELVAP